MTLLRYRTDNGNMAGQTTPRADDSAPDLEREALAARLAFLQRGTGYGLLVNLLVAGIAVGSLWNLASSVHLTAWLAVMLLALAIRFVLHRGYTRAPRSLGDDPHWRRLVTVSASAIALGWGWCGFVLIPLLGGDRRLLVLMLLILALFTGHTVAPFRATAGAFLVLAGLPLMAQLLLLGSPAEAIASAFALILLGVQWVSLEMFLIAIAKNIRLQRHQNWSELERAEYMRSVETANRLLAQTLSERELAEAQLKIAKQAAEDASRAKGEFLAYTSHEIRTPLNAIIGLTRVLLDTPVTDQQRDYLRRVRNAGGRLLTLINGLLDMSKIEAGKLEIESRDFLLREVLDNVVQEQIVMAREKGIGLDLEVGPDVPNFLVGDSLRVGQILRNLVGNAIKFTNKGKITIKASLVRSGGDTANILFAVIDTGIGIPPETQATLFQRYSQAEAGTSRKFGGTGLGLAISKSLCELMSGTMGLRSEPNKGSEFFFDLPFKVRAAAQVARPAHAAGAVQGGRALKVLVAEDGEDNQLLIELLLKRKGAHITIVENGQLAVTKLEQNHFDLVLMDLEMPVMNGFDAVAAIRENEVRKGGHVPVVALSAHALVGYREKCLVAGMDDYLTKPLDAAALYALMDAYAGTQTERASVPADSSQ